ncbi:MAG: HAD family hydrolase [Xenococcaceae cyanobacterium]
MVLYKVFIFDYDGTLCDSRAAIFYSLQETLKAFGFSCPEDDEIAKCFSTGKGLLYDLWWLTRQEGSASPKLINEMASFYSSFSQQYGIGREKLFPGAKEVTARLREEGDVFVVSNRRSDVLFKSLSFHGFSFREDYAIGVNDAIAPKPSSECFERLIFPLCNGIQKKEVLMVGDSVSDLKFARNCSIQSCWVSYGYGQKADCVAMYPHFIVDDLNDLEHSVSVGFHSI